MVCKSLRTLEKIVVHLLNNIKYSSSVFREILDSYSGLK